VTCLRQCLVGGKRLHSLGGAGLTALALVLTIASSARAAQVKGTLVAYEGSAAQAGRYLHFQNYVTRDCYLVATAPDGSFGAYLPPGVYNLRAERGAILAHHIRVGNLDLALGQVSDLAPYAPSRLWHRQAIAPSLLSSPAPSTANILTVDTTVLPPAPIVASTPLDAPRPGSASEAPNLPPPLPQPTYGGSAAAQNTR
jgi:hypothetical protein